MLEMTLAAKLQFVGFCSQGKIVPKGSKIPASIQPAGLLRCERGERCFIPLGVSGAEHFLNNTPAYNRKFCSARWGSDISDSAEPRQMLWDTLDLYLAKSKSKSELGIVLQRKKDRDSWDHRDAEHLVLLPTSGVSTTLIPSLSIVGFLLLTPGYPQGCVHPPVPSQGWFLLGSVPRAELRHKPFVQGTFVVTGTPSSAGPETWAFCKWCPNSPGCSFSPDSEPLAGLDLEIQF